GRRDAHAGRRFARHLRRKDFFFAVWLREIYVLMRAQQNMRGSSRMESKRNSLVVILALITLTLLGFGLRGGAPIVQAQEASAVHGQSHEQAERKSAGCIICHSPMDEATMHPTRTVEIGCTDCHGGNSSASVVAGMPSNCVD